MSKNSKKQCDTFHYVNPGLEGRTIRCDVFLSTPDEAHEHVFPGLAEAQAEADAQKERDVQRRRIRQSAILRAIAAQLDAGLLDPAEDYAVRSLETFFRERP